LARRPEPEEQSSRGCGAAIAREWIKGWIFYMITTIIMLGS
jgi:hypothetical protein